MRRRAVRVTTLAAFAGLPVFLTIVWMTEFVGRGARESDFWTFWASGRAVLHGASPYPSLHSLPAVATPAFAPFVYPPVTAFLMTPFALLPFGAAKIAFAIVNLVALAAALRLLGVRDWRCYGLAFSCAPVVAASGLGAVSILLLLAVAAAWRWRDRAVACGIAVALVITAKLFLWPLWFWLLRTRRLKAAAVAAGASLAAVAAAWAAIGFAGLRDYPRLLSRLTDLVGPHSYSAYALQRALGVSGGTAQTATYAAGLIALACALVYVADEQRSLVALLGVSLVATPILWPHYLVLLFVPVALASPRLSAAWAVPYAVWLDPAAWNQSSAARIAGVLALVATAVAVGLRKGKAPRARGFFIGAPRFELGTSSPPD